VQSSTDLWYGTSGPPDAEIVIVAESWGQEEDNRKRPLVGQSGVELDRMLAEAGIDRRKCLVTNMVAVRPQQNETFRLFIPKDQKPPRIGGLAPTPEVVTEICRLYRQIAAHPRKIVIALGNWALWALNSDATKVSIIRKSNQRSVPADLQTWVPGGITDWRGSMIWLQPHHEFTENATQLDTLSQIKLLPIIHPAAILRQWSQRTVTVHDLKARVPMALSNDWRRNPAPVTFSPPTLYQACWALNNWLNRADAGEIVKLTNDIETIRQTFISVMGFADSPHFAMCIPFVRRDNPDGSFVSYWSEREEATLVGLIRRVLTHPNIHIIGQNYIYDTQYIQYWMGVTPWLRSDTMLNQNVLFPGTPKDLSYLASLYSQYYWYWKEDSKDWDKLGDLQRLMDYNCLDNLHTWEIDDSQHQYAKHIGQEAQLEFKMKVNALCLRMMNRGAAVNTTLRGKMLFDLEVARSAYEQELLRIIPQSMVNPQAKTLWYRSAAQTRMLFYEILGFKAVRDRKTGELTVGKEAIGSSSKNQKGMLEKHHPEFTGLFRRLDRIGSIDTMLNVVQSKLERNERIQCSYNPGATETHRLSSSQNVWKRGTNLQNLTVGEEDD
jgi:uracil-DNA glycosylase